PVRRGDHAVRRAEEPCAPEAQSCPQRDLPGKTVVDPDLRNREEHGESERLARDHGQHSPGKRQAALSDRERPEHVHDGIEEKREVDREQVAPADHAELPRNRFDAVPLDGHYSAAAPPATTARTPIACRVKKSITTLLCSAVLSKIVESLEPWMTWVSQPAMPSAIAC